MEGCGGPNKCDGGNGLGSPPFSENGDDDGSGGGGHFVCYISEETSRVHKKSHLASPKVEGQKIKSNPSWNCVARERNDGHS